MYLLIVHDDDYLSIYNYISINAMLKEWGYSDLNDFLSFEQKSSCFFEIYEIKRKIV